MPYPEHWYVAFGGTAWGNEEWQCGIRMAGGPVQGWDVNDALDDVAADVEKFVTSSGARFPQGYYLNYCKLNRIGPDGLYVDKGNSYTHVYAPAIQGTTAPKQPPQIALVVTTLTDANIGPAHAGRFYWIGCAFTATISIGTSYNIGTADQTALANAAATLMQDLGDWPGLDVTGLAPAVVSKRGEGTWRYITGVRVDDVLDTQRRRAKTLPRTFVDKSV